MRLHRRLVDLVLELDEPYRSTIIAHFVEGRTSAAIARSLGIPSGTVRKRLWEALSRLRAGLDASAGDRRRWAPAVLAFAKGGVHVAKPTKVLLAVLAALLLISAATVVMVARPSSHREKTHASMTHAWEPSSTRPSEAILSSEAAPADASIAVVAPDARAARRAALREEIAKARSLRTSVPVGVIHHPAASAATSDSTGTTL